MRTGLRAYSTSKLCNVLTTYAFAERLAARSMPLTVVAYDPGLTPGTGLARRYPAPLRAIFARLLPLLVPLLQRFQHVQRVDQRDRRHWSARGCPSVDAASEFADKVLVADVEALADEVVAVLVSIEDERE